jgi:hypothetical protein
LEPSLDGAIDNFVCARILFAFLANLPVALRTKLIDLRKHPSQQLFRRAGWNARPLQIPYFFALPVDLAAHMFDFGPDR